VIFRLRQPGRRGQPQRGAHGLPAGRDSRQRAGRDRQPPVRLRAGAVNMAARAIRAGDGEIYLAGGVESMSRAPYSLPKAESGFAFGNLTAYDTALGWRYPNPK
jgi:hypothetical protein